MVRILDLVSISKPVVCIANLHFAGCSLKQPNQGISIWNKSAKFLLVTMFGSFILKNQPFSYSGYDISVLRCLNDHFQFFHSYYFVENEQPVCFYKHCCNYLYINVIFFVGSPDKTNCRSILREQVIMISINWIMSKTAF